MRTSACNGLHGLQERCARWILTTLDRVDADRFAVTKEFLAQLLGTNRPTVSVMVSVLEKAGMLNVEGRWVTVADRKRLMEASCECYMQGDEADAVFYIQNGTVKLTVASERGKEAVVGLLETGSFFGEGCLNGHRRRLATAAALTESSVLRIEKEEMVMVLRTEPAFAARFMSYLLERNSRIEEDLVDQLFNSSEDRLARVLLLLADFGKDHQQPEPILPKISQEMLAEMVGTTRSRVSFFMNKFRKLGFIHYNDTLEGAPLPS